MTDRRSMLVAVLLLCLLVSFAWTAPDPVATKIQGADTVSTPVQVQVIPAGNALTAQTAITSSNTGAAAAITATLAGAAAKTTWISGFEVTGGGATAASVIVVTVTGTISGTLNYDIGVPAGATAGAPVLLVTFNPPVPASAPNTSIVVNVPSFGAGNTNSAVTAHGFQQ